jgi:hypothetical protein
VETLCLHYRDLYLIRWRLHAQATKFQHTQLNENQDHESISDKEMDDADIAELIADISLQLEGEIPEAQL